MALQKSATISHFLTGMTEAQQKAIEVEEEEEEEEEDNKPTTQSSFETCPTWAIEPHALPRLLSPRFLKDGSFCEIPVPCENGNQCLCDTGRENIFTDRVKHEKQQAFMTDVSELRR